jgi:hypothetical protein
MQGRLLIFCGIPGSGKTTVARLVAGAVPGAVLVQTDAIRGMINHPSYSRGESDFVYRACAAVAKEALDKGRLVILDGTFGSSRRRGAIMSALEGYYYRADFVHMVCDLDTALRRNSTRDAFVPEERVKGILSAFEAPVQALTLDTSESSPEGGAEAVEYILLYPGPPRGSIP